MHGVRLLPCITRLAVDWFGGEPLPHLEGILSPPAELQALAARAGFTFAASMRTNGYLLRSEACEKLVERGPRRVLITSLRGPRYPPGLYWCAGACSSGKTARASAGCAGRNSRNRVRPSSLS